VPNNIADRLPRRPIGLVFCMVVQATAAGQARHSGLLRATTQLTQTIVFALDTCRTDTHDKQVSFCRLLTRAKWIVWNLISPAADDEHCYRLISALRYRLVHRCSVISFAVRYITRDACARKHRTKLEGWRYAA